MNKAKGAGDANEQPTLRLQGCTDTTGGLLSQFKASSVLVVDG